MASATSADRHFAVRLVNPFRGVLQVVQTKDARAYSPNGRVWQIQVLAERPDHTWRSHSDTPGARQFYNFGRWDARGGLQRVPANPVMDFAAMHGAADGLIDALSPLVEQLPFSLMDDFECWAMASDGRPIALLATTEDRAWVDATPVADWQATAGNEAGFTSPTLLRTGVQAGGSGRDHARQLESQVRQRVNLRAWFHRDGNGSGIPLDATMPRLAGADFPSLGITLDWDDDRQSRLARDYVNWLAPRLLLLQHIADEERAWLETAAIRQAVAIDEVFALLPRVIDANGIQAARVEATLRAANRSPEDGRP